MPQVNRKSDGQQVKMPQKATPRAAASSSSSTTAQIHRPSSTNAAPAVPREGSKAMISSSSSPRQKEMISSSSSPRQSRAIDLQRNAKAKAAAGPSASASPATEKEIGRHPPAASSARPASAAGRPPTADDKSTKSAAATTLGVQSKRWSRPTVADSRRLFSETEETDNNSRSKPPSDAETSSESSAEIPMGSRLPPDLLSLCFLKIESLYQLVPCALVCKAWREAFLSPLVWKMLYSNWWQENKAEAGERISHPKVQALPEGFSSWQSAFKGRIKEGKNLLAVNERDRAIRDSHLRVRQVADTQGRTVFDCVPGDGMQRLAERLGLSFEIRLNRGRSVKIRGRGKVDVFENSLVARYPASCISGLDLSALKSVEVTVTSDRLLRRWTLVEHTKLPSTCWDVILTMVPNAGPLRLLQQRLKSGVSMMVGTLAEGSEYLSDEINVKEGLLVLGLSFHLGDLLWTVMQLGCGPSSYSSRTVVRDGANPYFGLQNWSMSVQIHSFARSIWSRHFRSLVFSPQDSVPGDKAVFLPESCVEVFPGALKLPWKSEAFSGCLRGVFLLDVTVWDEGGEVAWTSNSAVRTDSVPLAVVEYGIDFDGERIRTTVNDSERGISLEIEMCIPVNFCEERAGGVKPMIAIRKLKVGMKKKFLQAWCGVANI